MIIKMKMKRRSYRYDINRSRHDRGLDMDANIVNIRSAPA